MNISAELNRRCDSKCELCASDSELQTCIVAPRTGEVTAEQVAVCNHCMSQMEGSEALDSNHWRGLNESIWNPEPAIQVVSYRMLQKLSSEGWAQDLLGMIYLDEATQEWAEASTGAVVHKDSNGQILSAGDNVVLIQDLNVKGGGFTAKRGTAVRRIRLVHDNPEHIEGKVDGQTIVILTKYVKKS